MNRVYEEKNSERVEEIDLLELIQALKKKIVYLILAAVLGGVVAGAYTKFMVTPLYTSTATVLVLSKDTTLTSIADLQLGTQLTSDYSTLMLTRPVLEEVIDNLGLDMSWGALKGSVTVVNPSSTRLLEITVRHPDPETAKKIADELAEVSSEYIADKMEVIPPKVIEDGVVSAAPVSPNVRKNILLGVLIGAVLAGGLVALRTIMDDTIKSEEDLEKYLHIPMLASVPDRKDYISGRRSGKKKGRKST